jgi:hypothetical protein
VAPTASATDSTKRILDVLGRDRRMSCSSPGEEAGGKGPDAIARR